MRREVGRPVKFGSGRAGVRLIRSVDKIGSVKFGRISSVRVELEVGR